MRQPPPPWSRKMSDTGQERFVRAKSLTRRAAGPADDAQRTYDSIVDIAGRPRGRAHV
ncbi:hypothetical protein [Streptomyces amakusaensis]|uniref:Uncharacterized protein n=1 Tax=Streptomyces amakusaensis TaxID=67271 RepID=A0ABW0AGF2_9ACTN